MADRLVALVTGASSGIGEAAARRLAREPGAELVLVARREERLRALADSLGGATVVAVDLTDAQAPEMVLEAVRREHGGALHLLVNNAGAGRSPPRPSPEARRGSLPPDRRAALWRSAGSSASVKRTGASKLSFMCRSTSAHPPSSNDARQEAGPGGRPERYVPRPYWLAAAARLLAPALVTRATSGGR